MIIALSEMGLNVKAEISVPVKFSGRNITIKYLSFHGVLLLKRVSVYTLIIGLNNINMTAPTLITPMKHFI
jgi:hypothetical protein